MKLHCICALILFVSLIQPVSAQVDSVLVNISLEGDFRFRVEQDWDSRRSDGSYRDDRSRLRYRFRTGATYQKDAFAMGFRIRTGQQNKQQDPQLTLGKGSKEFGSLPLGFEKIFFQINLNNSKLWLGKQSFSFDKNNELFWSDNVFPEGIYIEHSFLFEPKLIERLTLRGSHYVLSSNGLSFFDDAYFQGLQSTIYFKDAGLQIFPSIYLFRNIPNIPDGGHFFELDYTIFHLGAKLYLLSSQDLLLDFDIYKNWEDYNSVAEVPREFVDQDFGFSLGLQYGRLKNASDWMCKVTFTSLQKYAALDYMAQNDWARWDYSAFNSPDGRLSNFRGVEVVAGFNISQNINLITKYYIVNQIVAAGLFKETGQRVRVDLNVRI